MKILIQHGATSNRALKRAIATDKFDVIETYVMNVKYLWPTRFAMKGINTFNRLLGQKIQSNLATTPPPEAVPNSSTAKSGRKTFWKSFRAFCIGGLVLSGGMSVINPSSPYALTNLGKLCTWNRPSSSPHPPMITPVEPHPMQSFIYTEDAKYVFDPSEKYDNRWLISALTDLPDDVNDVFEGVARYLHEVEASQETIQRVTEFLAGFSDYDRNWKPATQEGLNAALVAFARVGYLPLIDAYLNGLPDDKRPNDEAVSKAFEISCEKDAAITAKYFLLMTSPAVSDEAVTNALFIAAETDSVEIIDAILESKRRPSQEVIQDAYEIATENDSHDAINQLAAELYRFK